MKIQEIVDQKMPSITEWLQQAGYYNTDAMREEDNNKRDRLEILYKVLGLQYDRPEKTTAREIADRSPAFMEIFNRRQDEKCALRLVPLQTGLPKLRVRGKTLKENLQWFSQQDIDVDLYKAEIIPHCDNTLYSAIFVVNHDSVWGEIIPGPHWQLTQGWQESDKKIVTFLYQKNCWHFTGGDTAIQNLTKEAVNKIMVKELEKQIILKQELQAEFNTDNYIQGYFEFVVWPYNGISYIDYNRVLQTNFDNFNPQFTTTNLTENQLLNGLCASPGQTTGIVHILKQTTSKDFETGNILVCPMTMIEHLPLMRKAGGIITEQGGLLSHAAIVSRELKKPCLVGTKNATVILKDGDVIFLDATNGIVQKIDDEI